MARFLPARPDLAQLRSQAKDLLRAAKRDDPSARKRMSAVSDLHSLAVAQLAIAREYGFASWIRLKLEVERRAILNSRDLSRLAALLTNDPALAARKLERWRDHPLGAEPLAYIAMLRFDSRRLRLPRDLPGTGAVARALLDAGAPVDGKPGDPETPLITAASYGDADVARVLIDAGADIEVAASVDAGGVPGGTALLHAAVFGMTEVVDLLVAAGARIHGIEEAAAAGDVSGWLSSDTPIEARIRSLVMAADHERLGVIDEIVAAGTPVDAEDIVFGRQALRIAATNGRPASVERLLALGADPNLRDSREHRTALEWCRRNPALAVGSPRYKQVEAILQTVTDPG